MSRKTFTDSCTSNTFTTPSPFRSPSAGSSDGSEVGVIDGSGVKVSVGAGLGVRVGDGSTVRVADGSGVGVCVAVGSFVEAFVGV